MKVLHVTPSYYPATHYGGPIFSTFALCNALVRIPGVELRVLTCDMAGPELSQRVPFDKIPVRFDEGYDVYFTKRTMLPDIAPGLVTRLWRLAGWADIVILTGTYSFPTLPALLVCKLRGKPLVWSPRGALQASHEWSGARRQGLKRIWERACALLRPRHATLHVTAEVEKDASLARLPGFTADIIPNAVELPPDLPPRVSKPGGTLRLMFISRVDPKKGLEILLQAMARLSPDTTLDIFGRGEPAYVTSLRRLAEQLGVGERVHFRGHVDGEAKRAAFIGADLFVFATHSENFGMVVAEALAHGVPAIVSHGAPWPDLDSKGCGRWVPTTPQAFAAAIQDLRDKDLARMGENGRHWMEKDFSWESRASQMHALFERLVREAA